VAAQIEHLAQTSPELHTQLAAIVAERGQEGGGHMPAGLPAPEGGDNVATNMQAQSDYLRDMVVSRLLSPSLGPGGLPPLDQLILKMAFRGSQRG